MASGPATAPTCVVSALLDWITAELVDLLLMVLMVAAASDHITRCPVSAAGPTGSHRAAQPPAQRLVPGPLVHRRAARLGRCHAARRLLQHVPAGAVSCPLPSCPPLPHILYSQRLMRDRLLR